MNKLDNKRFAVAGMIVLIILSVFVGAARSLYPMRSEAQQIFFEGVDKDGLGIQNDLNKRIELAYNLVTVARKYCENDTEEIKAVLSARDELTNAGSIKEKYRANVYLTEVTEDLVNELASYSLSEKDEKYRKEIRDDLASRNEIISSDGYNAAASKFNSELSSFPASIIGRLVGVRSLELFA